MNDAIRLHGARVAFPSGKDEFARWIELEDALQFLRADLDFEDFVIYSGVGDVFMHAVLVPTAAAEAPDFKDLMKWNFNPYHSGWGLCYSFNPPRVTLEPPLHGCGSQAMAAGEQLLFMRTFEGYEQKGTYVEILQKLLHVFSLHFIEERDAYCRLDGRGDLEDVITIHRFDNPPGHYRGGTVVTIMRAVLDEYMAATDMSVVRMFDITRYQPKAFSGWSDDVGLAERTDGDLHYRTHIESRHASYMRGVQIVRSRMSRDEAARKCSWGRPQDRKYESFVAVDRKHGGKICEISTAPGATATYFMESDLPWEVSPAFFRADVLLRYKADTDKYSLRYRSISCRGSWHLTTYDINDAGQVHTYIAYLRDLPYEEQLYWKALNEAPKGPMSDRAIATDLRGEWFNERDALEGIRGTVATLNEKHPSWWVRRPDKVIEKTQYVVTTSEDEWSNEILNLDQLTVEGFRASSLRTLAAAKGRSGLERLQSLKLIEECLMGLGWDSEPAREVTSPFHELHYLRSHVKAHDAGREAVTLRKGTLKQHRTFVAHFRDLCRRCDDSLQAVANALIPLG
jgi:hypothetical protein